MKKIYITLDSHPLLERRLRTFVQVLSVIALAIILRYWYLQIARHSYFLEMSEKNRIRNVKIVAPRGSIRDRTGKVIATSAPSFTLEIVREETADKGRLLGEIAALLKKDSGQMTKLFEEKAKVTPRLYPVVLLENLQRNEVIALEAQKWRMKGIRINFKSERSYPFAEQASHLLGYVSQITRQDIENLKTSQYGGKIGKAGLENLFEDYLKGFDGVEKIEVDASGRKQKVLYKIDPVSGGGLQLTIDWKLQEVAEKALGEKNGAVVAVSPKTGEVLAVASHPNFNPNMFVHGADREEWKKIVNNPYHPLQNKAFQGMFPPGSTFKLITAIAGLEEGVISRETSFHCPGYKKIGNKSFRCWRDSGHGKVNVHRALVESCDVFFYETALKVGPERLADYAKKFYFGEKTGIGLKGELAGIVPSPRWKKQRHNQRWYDGDTLPFAIGQGYLSVTPLQLAMAYAAFSNGGTVVTPVIIKEIETNEGRKIEESIPRIKGRNLLKPETIEIVRKGLIGVVNEGGGTGSGARLHQLIVAGKTGTAQVRSMKDRVRLSGFMNDHAWFAGFAPAHDPEIVVCVFVMHGGHGGGAAAPVAKEVMQSFFSVKNGVKRDNEKDTTEQ